MPRFKAILALLILSVSNAPAADLGPRITTTDGKSYTRGADGHYYPSALAATSAPVVAPAYPAVSSSCPGGKCPAPTRPAQLSPFAPRSPYVTK